MRSELQIGSLILALGCGGVATTVDSGTPPEPTGPDPALACPGGIRPPSLRECSFVGDGFAECGGTSEPRLACMGDCKWFLGGCVPLEYTASPCSTDAMCCVDDFPFPITDSTARYQRSYLIERDARVWDRSALHGLAVVIDPSVVAPATVTVVCSGPCAPTSSSLCRLEPGQIIQARDQFGYDDTPTIVIGPQSAYAGTTLRLELFPREDGSFVGLATHNAFTDAVASPVPCPFGGPVDTTEPAMRTPTGTITLDRMPTEVVHGHAELVFSECFSMTVSF